MQLLALILYASGAVTISTAIGYMFTEQLGWITLGIFSIGLSIILYLNGDKPNG